MEQRKWITHVAVVCIFAVSLTAAGYLVGMSQTDTTSSDLQRSSNEFSQLNDKLFLLEQETEKQKELLEQLLSQIAISCINQEKETTDAEPLSDTIEWVVQPGDTLWSIALRLAKQSSEAFIEHTMQINGITDPTKLPVGAVIKLPIGRKYGSNELF